MITNNPMLILQLLNKNKMKMNIHSKKNNIQLNNNRKNTETKMMTRLIIVKTSSKEEHLIQTMKRKKLLKIGMKKVKIKNMKLTSVKDNLKNMI
jgi:predicted transcriptional regulator YdeE